MRILSAIFIKFLVLPVLSELPPCNGTDTLFADGDTTVRNLFCYEDGRPRMLLPYRNGKLHGTEISWYPNGIKGGISKYKLGEYHGPQFGFFESGDTSMVAHYINGVPIGSLKRFYAPNQPKRFTNFNDNGDKHGWEIFWYDNGNVKDSILFRNDSTMQRRSYYYNGKPQMFEDDIYGTYDAVSFNPKGKRTGKIKDGTGTVFLCDSVGGDCKELKYKGGKRIVE